MSLPAPSDVSRRLSVGELGWDDVVGAPGAVAQLRALVAQATGGGLVVVVTGPAGVGKTFAARVWAESMRLDLWRVDCGALLERHRAGAATRGLAEVLPLGERPHAILLFHDAHVLPADVLDALLARAAARLAPTVLETREPCPPEVTVRLAALETVELSFPGAAERSALWRRLVERASPLAQVDLEVLAALEVPGAVIDAAVRAAVLAHGDERLDTETLVSAACSLRG